MRNIINFEYKMNKNKNKFLKQFHQTHNSWRERERERERERARERESFKKKIF